MLRRTLGTTTTLMAARMAGAALTFGTQVLVSRLLGPAALGQFLLMVAAIGITSVLLPLGFQALAQYFVAEYDTAENRGLQRGFLATAYRVTLIASTILVAGAAAGSALAGPGLVPWATAAMLVVALSAPAAALLTLGSGVALALKRPFLALLPDMLGKPIGLLVCALALAAMVQLSPYRLAGALGAVLWAVTIIQGSGLRRVLARRGPAVAAAMDLRRWWYFAPAWLVTLLVGEFTIDLDMLLLGGLMPAGDVGMLGAAVRIFVLESFALTAVYAVALPAVFAAGRNAGDKAMAGALAHANVTATLVALGCVVATAALGAVLLGVFGPDFAAAQPALLILVASLVVKAAFGPAALVLSVFDRPYASIPALLAGLAVLVALNLTLVPAYGITGAAAALSIASSFGAVMQWLVTLRLTGRNIALRAGDLRQLPLLLFSRPSA